MMEKYVISIKALLVAAIVSIGFGFWLAWHVQGARVESAKEETKSVKASFKTFEDGVKKEGEAAKVAAFKKEKEDKLKKEQSDEEYSTKISALAADNERLRHKRSSGSFVPAASTNARNPGLACFDRTELERAIRSFDSGLQGLVDKGSADTIGLDTARRWAASIREPASMPEKH